MLKKSYMKQADYFSAIVCPGQLFHGNNNANTYVVLGVKHSYGFDRGQMELLPPRPYRNIPYSGYSMRKGHSSQLDKVHLRVCGEMILLPWSLPEYYSHFKASLRTSGELESVDMHASNYSGV